MVGLAVARRLALDGHDVVVLETEAAIGMHTSSRNSEVIHAGIYYATDSLKAKLCVAGKRALYRYCEEHSVAHRRCGKLIVAAHEDQMPALDRIHALAQANGVDDLQWLSATQARAMEPHLACVGALYSPSTGIIDSYGLMLAYQADAEQRGAVIALRSPVQRGRVRSDCIELDVGGAQPTRIQSRVVVNSAGLHAQKLAAVLEGYPTDRVPPSYYCKGNYYSLGGRAPFSRLIYPVPESAGLGVHLTLDLAGQARFGPDVEWVDTIDYGVDPGRCAAFYREIRRYWPKLADGALQPAYAGIRPKIQAPGEPARDFCIEGPVDHGVAGLVNLFGIESPGLTASLAIAEHVHGLLR